MVASTTAPEAPGKLVVTETWGGTISGYWAIGIEYRANAPAIVVTMAMTMASRGRSTKTEESIESAPQGLRDRTRSDRYSRTDPLQAFDDNLFASGQARIDDDVRSALGTGLDALNDGLAVLDDEHIDASLVGDQRRLGNHDLFLGSAALQIDPHQLAVDEPTIRVRHGGAGDDRIGRTIDRHIDEIDLAELVVNGSIRKSNLDLDVLDVGWLTALSLQEFALAHRERDIHRILADDCGEDAAVAANDTTFGHGGARHVGGNRCGNLGITQIDLRGRQVGLAGHDRPLRSSLRPDGLVQRHAGTDVLCAELRLPLPVFHRQLVLSFARLQCALGLLNCGFEQVFLDAVQWVALFDEIALLEQDGLQVAFYSRSNFDAVDRFY